MRPATAVVLITSLIGIAGTASALYLGETVPKEGEVSPKDVVIVGGLVLLAVGIGAHYIAKKQESNIISPVPQQCVLPLEE